MTFAGTKQTDGTRSLPIPRPTHPLIPPPSLSLPCHINLYIGPFLITQPFWIKSTSCKKTPDSLRGLDHQHSPSLVFLFNLMAWQSTNSPWHPFDQLTAARRAPRENMQAMSLSQIPLGRLELNWRAQEALVLISNQLILILYDKAREEDAIKEQNKLLKYVRSDHYSGRGQIHILIWLEDSIFEEMASERYICWKHWSKSVWELA